MPNYAAFAIAFFRCRFDDRFDGFINGVVLVIGGDFFNRGNADYVCVKVFATSFFKYGEVADQV